MVSVTVGHASAGFVGAKLISLLQTHGLGLAESHRLATEVNDGGRASVLFDDPDAAARFAAAARALHVDAFVNVAAASKATA